MLERAKSENRLSFFIDLFYYLVDGSIDNWYNKGKKERGDW